MLAALLSSALVVAGHAQGAASPLTRIGAAAAVSGLVKAQAPGAVGRVMGSGKPLFLNDHIVTDAKGRLQIMLLDETIFTLGPNSDMVLDEFVYDPNTNSGKVAANMAKGTFRFVSGKIARKEPKNVSVKMPVGTLGIRGTIVAGQVGAEESTVILLGPGAGNNAGESAGAIQLDNAGGSVFIDQPGYGSTMKDGAPPTPPSDMSAIAGQILGEVGGGGASGGSGDGKSASSGGSSPGKSTASNDEGDEGGSTGGTTAQSSPADSDDESASDSAGQTTASAGDSVEFSADVDEQTDDADTTAALAFSDAVEADPFQDGVANWEDILAQITEGTDQYSGSGTYFCSGGTCGNTNGVAGTMSFTLQVDFGARTVGGGSSQVILNSATNGLDSFGGDSTNILQHTFDGFTGPAELSLSASNLSNSRFDGTTLTLKTAGGVIARDATVGVSYTGTTGESISGSATGSRSPVGPQ